jgi:predicted HicB family RNase H-like nuclease
MMQYKGYKASVQFDDEAKILHGEVLGLRDVVTFQADSVSELEKAFHDSVDDYLEFCKERGEEPERPYSGKFLLRLDPSLHRQVDVAAAAAGQSVNAWVANILEVASGVAPTPARGEQATRAMEDRGSAWRELADSGSSKRFVTKKNSAQASSAGGAGRRVSVKRGTKSKMAKR